MKRRLAKLLIIIFSLSHGGLSVEAYSLSSQTTKQRILSLVHELYPEISGTSLKANVKKPSVETALRVEKALLSIASESPEARSIVASSLVELLGNPAIQDGYRYSTLWYCACRVLGELKAVEAVEVLSQNLDIQEGPLTLSFSGFPAVQGLIQIGEPAIASVAEVLLTNPKVSCRGLAAFTLGRIGGDPAMRALERAYAVEKDPSVLKAIEVSRTAAERQKN